MFFLFLFLVSHMVFDLTMKCTSQGSGSKCVLKREITIICLDIIELKWLCLVKYYILVKCLLYYVIPNTNPILILGCSPIDSKYSYNPWCPGHVEANFMMKMWEKNIFSFQHLRRSNGHKIKVIKMGQLMNILFSLYKIGRHDGYRPPIKPYTHVQNPKHIHVRILIF